MYGECLAIVKAECEFNGAVQLKVVEGVFFAGEFNGFLGEADKLELLAEDLGRVARRIVESEDFSFLRVFSDDGPSVHKSSVDSSSLGMPSVTRPSV